MLDSKLYTNQNIITAFWDLWKTHESFTDKIKRYGFKPLDKGDFRNVFVRRDVVIKVPYVQDGIVDNLMEAKAWKKYGNKPTDLGLHLAPCRLLDNYALMMVRVEAYEFGGQRPPSWAKVIDNCQCGLYKGKVVAFDYALNLTERYHWEKQLDLDDTFFQRYWIKEFPQYDKSAPHINDLF